MAQMCKAVRQVFVSKILTIYCCFLLKYGNSNFYCKDDLLEFQSSIDLLLTFCQVFFLWNKHQFCNLILLRWLIFSIYHTVRAWQNPVMVNFIDFRKAFDCIHRPSLWSILRQYGIPEEIVNIIQNLYKDSKSNVKINGISGEWFEVVTGMRQGCVLSPLLFAIVLDWVMKKSLKNHNGGLEWTDGKKLCDLDFADDIALIETSQTGMQKLSEEDVWICRSTHECSQMQGFGQWMLGWSNCSDGRGSRS